MQTSHEVSRGDFKPFDFTLTTYWGEAARKAGFASERRYILLKNRDLIGIFQGLAQRVFFHKSIRAGSTSGNGILVLPSFPKSVSRWFLLKILKRERFSDSFIFTPFSLELPGFIQKNNYTFYINLEHEFNDIMRSMEKKTRNRVHKAEKLGVVVNLADSMDALNKAYKVINLASAARFFTAPAWPYTVQLHKCFKHPSCCSTVALSYDKDGEVVSAAHLIGFDRKMMLWQAGSTSLGYKLNAGSLVQAEIIKWSQDHGYLIYDMGGTNPIEEIYSGIHRFKSGFGGRLVTNKLLQKRAFYVPVASRVYRAIRNVGLTGV